MFNFDVNFNEVDEDIDENEILLDEKKAQNLVLSLIAKTREEANLKQIKGHEKKAIRTIKKVIANLDIENEIEMFYNLKKILKKIYEVNLNPALKNKNIIGVAGGFSSGKSTFLNSIIEREMLPQDIETSSAIPTYILKGSEGIKAQNFFLKSFDLTESELNAISHQFQTKYNITFSRILENITVSLDSFPYDNICFLDTPGYTKSDLNLKSNNTDRETAKKHLLATDYIIWVCDIENGTIKKEDLDFIKALHLSKEKEILVILNKCDKKTREDSKKIKDQVEKEIIKNKINIFGVALYSSFEKEEYTDDIISKFLKKLNGRRTNLNYLEELEVIRDNLEKKLSFFKDKIELEENIIKTCIKDNRKSGIENYKYILEISKRNREFLFKCRYLEKLINYDLFNVIQDLNILTNCF